MSHVLDFFGFMLEFTKPSVLRTFVKYWNYRGDSVVVIPVLNKVFRKDHRGIRQPYSLLLQSLITTASIFYFPLVFTIP